MLIATRHALTLHGSPWKMQNRFGSSVVHVYATRSGKCLKMAHEIWYRLVLSARAELVATTAELDFSADEPEEPDFSAVAAAAVAVGAESDSGRAMSVLELDDEDEDDDEDDVVDEDEEHVVKPFRCCRCFSQSGLLKNSPM